MTPIFRHRRKEQPPPISHGDPDRQRLIEDHVEATLGPIQTVFHEIISPHVHIDVLMVQLPTEPPATYLVTSGMSERAMPAPDGAPGRAELVIILPPEWPTDEESWKDARNSWPVEWLKQLARLPHEFDTYLGHGHTIPNGDPAEPYAPDTDLCCAMILPPLMTEGLGLDDVVFYGVYFLHSSEMEYKLAHGTDALLNVWDENPDDAPTEVVTKDRPPALG